MQELLKLERAAAAERREFRELQGVTRLPR